MSLTRRIKILSEDTLFRGAFCGIVAGVLKNLVDSIMFAFKMQEVVFWEYASMIAYHKGPKGFLMHASAIILELIFCAFLGIIYILIAERMKTRFYLFMGVFYGSMIWFSVKSFIVLFEINNLKPETVKTPLITWVLSMLFGVIVAHLERKLSPKTS